MASRRCPRTSQWRGGREVNSNGNSSLHVPRRTTRLQIQTNAAAHAGDGRAGAEPARRERGVGRTRGVWLPGKRKAGAPVPGQAPLPPPWASAMASGSGAGAAGAAAAANLNAVRETMDVLLEISRILNTGLDMETLSICVRLCEQGINPEALSSVIKELRKATEALKTADNMTS
ncbi:mitotic-spindle organizing protein 1 [Ochotona princeps]|uniref:mitotic-spindle organizing protein 1 n=2 Tax=Ochotona TaxID=9977 RepID=UPI00271452A8|nr:mitotic-spindle organizing protein 1 [Ochotona princeps]